MDRPTPTLIRSFKDAEQIAAAWLRYFGFADAEANTRGGPDEGIDIISTDLVVQVKAEVGKVGRPIIQQIAGVAAFESKKAAVFSLGGYTEEAISWASNAGVALFSFDLTGEPITVNDQAHHLATQGGDPDEVTARKLLERSKLIAQTIEVAMNGYRESLADLLEFEGKWPEAAVAQWEKVARWQPKNSELNQMLSEVRSKKEFHASMSILFFDSLRSSADGALNTATEMLEHLINVYSRNPTLAAVWDARLTTEAESLRLRGEAIAGLNRPSP